MQNNNQLSNQDVQDLVSLIQALRNQLPDNFSPLLRADADRALDLLNNLDQDVQSPVRLAQDLYNYAHNNLVNDHDRLVIMNALHVALDNQPNIPRGVQRSQLFNQD